MLSSIRDGIDGTTLANQIRLERATHMGSFLLVEGNNDAKLFGKFCDQQACSIVVCMGRDYLLNAISDLELSGFCGVLGFADRDFSEFLSYPKFNGKVVFSDENDIEIMILCSAALEDLLREYGSENRVAAIVESTGRQVCDLVFDAASFIGTLRLLSQREGWSLLFEGMAYQFRNNNSYILDEVKTMKHIVARSKVKLCLTESQILIHVRNLVSSCGDVKNLCCGHDCVRILGRALKSEFGKTNQIFNNKAGAKNLERILRLTYEYEYFQRTKAYEELRDWEIISGFKVLR